MIWLTDGSKVAAIQMIEKECDYMYVQLDKKEYCTIVVKNK
jgi:hypothetical protein